MTKRSWLLACALLAACGKTAKEKEPNDQAAQAGVLPAGGKAVGTIGAPGDVDAFKLAIDRDRAAVSLHVGGIRGVDFVLSVQDQDGQELKRYDETALGGDEHALDLGLAKGEYLVVLSNKNAKADNPSQEYELKCVVEPAEGREWEPNDRALLATPVSPGGVTRGHYFPTQDLLSGAEDKAEEDWFRVMVDRPGAWVLNLDLSEVAKVDPVLEVYDANGYRLKEVDAGGPGEPETLRQFGVRGPAEFLLRLRTKPARSGALDPGYELLTELLPYDGRAEFEPNDRRDEATELSGASISGALGGPGDADWYRLVVPEGGPRVLRAEVSGIPGLDLRLEALDAQGAALLAVDDAGKDQPELLAGLGVQPGTYYLAVSEKTGKAGDPAKTYALSKALDAWAPGLEFEGGASSATAAIAPGASVDGYLAPRGDADVYWLTLAEKTKVALELTALPGVRWTAALLGPGGEVLQEASAKKPAEALTLERELEAGTYSVRLSAGEPSQSNPRDKYTLRARSL